MSERLAEYGRRFVILGAVLLLASACGTNLSGEPEIVRQSEIVALPTATLPATQALTPAPTQETSGAASGDVTPTGTPAAAGTGIDLTNASYDLGFQVYMRECAVCHGAANGVGPSLTAMRDRAPTVVAGLSAEEYLWQSIVEPGAFVVEGYQDVMPKDYGQTLTQDEIAGLVRFILEFDPATMMGGAQSSAQTGGQEQSDSSQPPAIEQEESLVVRGRLIQGTAGGETLPAGLPMQLYVLDVHGNLAGTYETQSGEGGAFVFENVARAPGNVYLVQVTYDDIPQGAQIPAINGDEQTITQDVTVYEHTTDPATVAITWAQILINYAPIQQFGLEVWLRLELANTGDRIVTLPERAGPNDWYASVAIELPPAAFGIQPMQAEGSQRYDVQVEDGVPVVRDTWPLRPGQVHTITIAYYLPYEDGAVIDQAFSYPVVDGAVLLPNDTVTLRSAQLDEEGAWRYRVSHGGVRVTELAADEKIDPSKDFTLVKEHPLIRPLPGGERLAFELVGRPTRTLATFSTTSGTSRSNTNIAAIVLAVAGVTALVLAGVLWLRQRKAVAPTPVTLRPADGWQEPPANADRQTLLRAVAALDDAYEAGKLDEETYQERRALLMERLLPLMGEDE
jgi:cytochrome c5